MIVKKISYSGIRQFCNCRRAYYYERVKGIVPLIEHKALSFGAAWHEALEAHYRGTSYCTDDPKIIAMMQGYKRRWAGDFKVIATELPFEIMVRSPQYARAARNIRFRGIIDLIIKRGGEVWIMEHKTTSRLLDNSYHDRLWHDLQVMLYAHAYQEMTGDKVEGIVYNVVKKTSIKQGAGETPEEYRARYTALCTKSKTGKSSAKRKTPETDREYQGRLNSLYDNPDMYHREELLCDDRRLDEVRSELFDTCKEIAGCNNYYKNRAQCFVYGECEYFKICGSGDNPIIIDNHYKKREERI